MASVEEVQDSLVSFAALCNENKRLQAMIREWNRVLSIHALDLNQTYTLTTNAGMVTVAPGSPAAADMVVKADSDVLTDVFYGEVSPNEPYSDGSLQVHGSEDDILHLDFITAMLWE